MTPAAECQAATVRRLRTSRDAMRAACQGRPLSPSEALALRRLNADVDRATRILTNYLTGGHR